MADDPRPATPTPVEKDAEDLEVCINCMAPNERLVNFCEKCGAPLQSTAAISPFERIFAEGFIYRQAAERPRSLIVVIGVWVLFGLSGVAGALILLRWRDIWHATGTPSTEQEVLERAAFLAGGAFMLVISVLMIWRSTRSYLAHREERPNWSVD